MQDPTEDLEPLDLLKEELLDRRRRGEAIDVEAFADEHPSHAQEIRELFPTLLAVEGASDRATPSGEFGRWRVVRELGRGGMGVVYLVEDPKTGERAALKTLTGERPGDLARFRREAAVVARLSHRNLCRIVELAPVGEPPWIAFEYVEGETLAHAIRRERSGRDEGRPRVVPTARWLEIGAEIAAALHSAHEAGLVHRDVKPSNVLLASDRAVVLDFGLAHEDVAGDRTRLTHTGVPVGTPAYMSPEQVRAGSAPLDRRTDVYSLGATLYEAFTLEPPFPGPTVAAVFSQILTSDPEPLRRRVPALPADLELVLATAMHKQAARRYATAQLFAEDLLRVRRGERIRARAPSTATRLATWAGRHPRTAAAVATVGVALVTGLVVAVSLLAQVSHARDREARSARLARARALASASAEARATDGVLSLLLAREAVRAERNAETLTQLHAAVTQSLERARLEGHEAAVTSIAWDGTGRRVATGSPDGRARVFRADGSLLHVLPEVGAISQGRFEVALSPSGSQVATRDGKGAVRLWREDGGRLREASLDVEPASHAIFLSDGSLACVGRRGRVSLHDDEGRARASWRVPLDREDTSDAVSSAYAARDVVRLDVLTRDRRRISYDASGTEVGRDERAVGATMARLIGGGRLAFRTREDAGGGGERLRVVAHDGADEGGIPGPFGADLLLTGGDTWWSGWSAAKGAVLVGDHGASRVLEMQRSEPPGSLVAAADGSRLLTVRSMPGLYGLASYATDAMRLWVAPVGTPIAAVTAAGDFLESIAFSPDGSLLALGHHRARLASLHATTPTELATEVPRWRQGNGYRYAASLTADGRQMVTYADERTLRVLRDDGSQRARWTVAPPGKSTRWLSLEPTRESVLVTGQEGDVVAYDLDGRELLRLAPQWSTLRASWLGDEGRFLTLVPGRVRFHAPDGSVAKEVDGTLVAHNPARGAGDEVAVESGGGEVRVHDSRGDVRRTLDGPAGGESAWYEGCRTGFSVSMSGLRAGSAPASGGLGTCRYLDPSGRVVWETPVGGVGDRQAALSSDGSRVAFVVSGGLELRDATGRHVAALRIDGGVACIGFDGTGTQIAASSLRGTVRVWDREGRVRFDLPDASGACYVGFSDDGRRIATITSAMARLFTTDAGELEALAARRSPRGLSDLERARFADILEGAR